MSIAKHNINDGKSLTILLLKGYSCSTCIYKLMKARGQSGYDGLSHEPFFGWESYYELKRPHCALYTDIQGKVSKKSVIVNECPCKNYSKSVYLKNSIVKRI